VKRISKCKTLTPVGISSKNSVSSSFTHRTFKLAFIIPAGAGAKCVGGALRLREYIDSEIHMNTATTYKLKEANKCKY
jgi:hypothetical protein